MWNVDLGHTGIGRVEKHWHQDETQIFFCINSIQEGWNFQSFPVYICQLESHGLVWISLDMIMVPTAISSGKCLLK